MKDTLKVEAIAGYGKVVYNKQIENNVLIQLIGAELEEEKRAPISIIALLDVSSSMSPEYKIGYVKKSMVKLIDNLKVDDQLCMITYDSNVDLVFDLADMTPENKKRAASIASSLTARAMTNMSGALSEAKDVLKRHQEALSKEGRVVRTILFSDGCPTTGNTDKDILISMGKDLPIGQLTSMGYGKESTDPYGGMTGMGGELDVLLLQELARVGNGNYYYMKDPDSCGRAFAYELAGLLTIAAQNITIEIETSKFFEVTEVIEDVDSEIKNGTATITLPDVMAEETKYLLIKGNTLIQNQAFPRETKTPVKVKYTNTEGDKVEAITDILLNFVKDGKEDKDIDKDVQTQIAIIEAAKAHAEAAKAAEAGDYASAVNYVNVATDALYAAGTDRACSEAASVGCMAQSVANRANWTKSSNDFYAHGHTMRTGRTSGNAKYATRAQTNLASAFTIDDTPANPDPAPNPGNIIFTPNDPVPAPPPVKDNSKKKRSTIQRF